MEQLPSMCQHSPTKYQQWQKDRFRQSVQPCITTIFKIILPDRVWIAITCSGPLYQIHEARPESGELRVQAKFTKLRASWNECECNQKWLGARNVYLW